MLTPEQQTQAVVRLAHHLIDAAVGYDHAVVLDALLNAFVAIAKTQLCCTQESANAALRASMLLAQHAATHSQHSVH